MPITELPVPPSRSDSPQDFSDRADALLGALPGFVTEANALQSDVNAKESSASSHATVATDKAAEAQGYATTATTKASEAAASAVAAAAAASNAEIAFDSFDDKYLGSKAGDPATDNDGNPLLTGALYWNTTVGAVRVWNGSSWLSMAADASIVDFQQAGSGAVVRTAQDKLREWVSVKDFGAAGDGVTDDAAAIQAALTACAGGGLFFPAGTYIIGSLLLVPSNVTLFGVGEQSVLKLKSQPWVGSNGLMLRLVADSNVTFNSLKFDGNKGNVGVSRSPLIVVFDSQRVSFIDCTFSDSEGICLNISTDCDDFTVDGCKFFNCGGDPSNSDGYRKQAIAFSTNGVDRSRNVVVSNCYFYRQGLDCISLNDCDNVIISGNTSVESYVLLYNNASPSYSTNVTVVGNVVRTCSEFGASTTVPPGGIDLPSVRGLSVVGNSLYDLDSGGIGIFAGTENAVVTGNTIVNPMRASLVFKAGITVAQLTKNVSVTGNNIVDTGVSPLMPFGIVFGSTATNVHIAGNHVTNPLTANIGYYTSDPVTVSAFTASSPVDVSSRVVDYAAGSNLETTYGRTYFTGSTIDPLVRITQTGAGDCFRVEDSTTPDSTAYVINNDGKVGIRISTGTFNSGLSVADSSTNELVSLLQYSNDPIGAQLRGYKSRAASPYAHTATVVGDELLTLAGFASDGTTYRVAARIALRVEGVTAGDVAGGIVLQTVPVGSASPIDRVRVKSSGQLRFIPQATPTGAEEGDVYFDSTSKKLRCYSSGVWNDLF